MTERDVDVPGTVRDAGRPPDAAFFALLVGMTACVAAVISGLVLAFDKVVVDCPGGTEFPDGATDYNCYTHPDSALGISIVALAVAVGVALVFLRAVLDAVQEQRPPASS